MASRPRSTYNRPPKNEQWGTVAETNLNIGGKRNRKMSKDGIEESVERLSSTKNARIPDSNRTGALKEAGIMNSYAWKGY